MARLAQLHRDWKAYVDGAGPKLVDRALYSTYRDCEALGLQVPARQLLGLPQERG